MTALGPRVRWAILVAVVVLATGAVAAYLVVGRTAQQAAATTTSAGLSLAQVQQAPYVVVRNTELGAHYGDVAEIPLATLDGARAFTTVACDRVAAAPTAVLCLSSNAGIVTTYRAELMDTALTHPVEALPLTGLPSRARVASSGRFAATTSFTAGDSYASTSFSTRTVITALGQDTSINLEDFTLVHQGRSIEPVDRNYWGVTFAPDGDTFYATVAFSGSTWLVRGSISRRTVTTLHQDAECPSLSPDGTHIVFKQRAGLPAGQWRLAAYDVATGTVTPLAEHRSVDDQVEWLDDSHVLYGLNRTGSQAAVSDVWSVPADGSGTPQRVIQGAFSPTVVR